MPHRIFRVIFAVIVLCGVTALSLLPAPDLPAAPAAFPFTLPYFDKLIHFGFYLTATLAALFALGSERVLEHARFRWGPVIALTLYGALMEAIQHTIPTRSFDLRDILANTLGALAALFAARLYLHLSGKDRPEPRIKFTFNATGPNRHRNRF